MQSLSSLLATPQVAQLPSIDGVSAAALFRIIEAEHPTLRLDEIDTHDLGSHGMLRGVLNSGHHRGGRMRELDEASGASRAIGSSPLLRRWRLAMIAWIRCRFSTGRLSCICGEPTVSAKSDALMKLLKVVGNHLRGWARSTRLERDPKMPELNNRTADNWRPLVAIAVSCGGDWGVRAREAAISMSGQHADEDLGVTLLNDIQVIFNGAGVDRISSADLVAALIDLNDGPWSEWRGRNNNQQPRPISPTQLTQLLRSFRIQPRSMWRGPRSKGTSAKGYLRRQFEEAWRSYCSSKGDAAPRVLRMLKR